MPSVNNYFDDKVKRLPSLRLSASWKLVSMSLAPVNLKP